MNLLLDSKKQSEKASTTREYKTKENRLINEEEKIKLYSIKISFWMASLCYWLNYNNFYIIEKYNFEVNNNKDRVQK